MITRSSSSLTSLLLVASLAAACADEDPADPMQDGETTEAAEGTGEAPGSTGEVEPDSSGGAEESSGGGIDVDALYDCVDPDFTVIQPLTGPGIDPETGEIIAPLQDGYVLHTTQILVRPEKLEDFIALNVPIAEQLMMTEGLVGFALAQEPNCGFSRTMGVWESEAAMYAFVASGAHAQAMAKTTEVSITGRTTMWTAAADEMPLTWEMAIEAIADVEPSAVYE